MKKIPSLFCRNYETDRLIRDEIVPGCEWVAAGEGVATLKLDGTSCLVSGGKLFKRYELKKGRTAPDGFVKAQEPDAVTGEVTGWVAVGDGPDDRYHREAWEAEGSTLPDGTYELIGPKVQGNPEGWHQHELMPHGAEILDDCPRDFAGIRAYVADRDMEGIVFWRDPDDPESDRCKVKKKDFGFKR